LGLKMAALVSQHGKLTLIKKLEGISAKALVRLEQILEKGSDKDALDAAKLVLSRTLPEPKINTAEVARQAALGAGAGASAGMVALAGKAHARLTGPDITDATYSTVHTPTKGVKE
jgi:hypothetical protein